MKNSIELKSMNLLPLQRDEQIAFNGGVAALPLAAASPIFTIYAAILATAYYAGYGAHVIYDAVTDN